MNLAEKLDFEITTNGSFLNHWIKSIVALFVTRFEPKNDKAFFFQAYFIVCILAIIMRSFTQ